MDDSANLPEAKIVHLIPGRLRIRVPARSGNRAYFAAAVEKLSSPDRPFSVDINENTGSFLFTGKEIDPVVIGSQAAEMGLFVLTPPARNAVPISRRLVEPLGQLNRSLQRFTRGEVDLAGAAFIGLITVGVVQIVRGNLRLPPWYTAFWYAMGVFSKSIVDRIQDERQSTANPAGS